VEAITRETDDAVLVTDATCSLLGEDHGGFAARGSVALRGRREPVKVHAALAAANFEEVRSAAPRSMRRSNLA
jgi:class 3 adenylate cyclase